MQCPKCGYQRADGSVNCEMCGVLFDKINQSSPSSQAELSYTEKMVLVKEQLEQERRPERLAQRVHLLTTLAVLVVFVVGIWLLFFGLYSHLDLPSGCTIGIQLEHPTGGREAIRQAIALIKAEDKGDYRTLCQYVDTINERRGCQVADNRGTTEVDPEQLWQQSCYVRGTKYVYLSSDLPDGDSGVRERAERLIKHAKQSKDFWEGTEENDVP